MVNLLKMLRIQMDANDLFSFLAIIVQNSSYIVYGLAMLFKSNDESTHLMLVDSYKSTRIILNFIECFFFCRTK